MNFIIDAQLPPALARWLVEQGHSSIHVIDLGMEAADDQQIWEEARNRNAVVISKDEDFVDLWLLSDGSVSLVWLRKGNCSSRALVEWLKRLWPEASRRLEQGERLIELRT